MTPFVNTITNNAMRRVRMGEPDLADRLSIAIRNYKDTWKPVDDELYKLCRRRCHDDLVEDVYTKVAIVGRVYEAGVPRAWGKQYANPDPVRETAQALTDQAQLIQEGLQRLAGHAGHFGLEAAREIVDLHDQVTKAINKRSGNLLTSFVSKYLHFHCPIVPIIDTRADAAISKLVDRRGRRIRKVLTDLPKEVRAYRSFVAAFVALHERAYAETMLKPSVKELDHLLWRMSSMPRTGQVSGGAGYGARRIRSCCSGGYQSSVRSRVGCRPKSGVGSRIGA
jgi:hypothetical protein